MADPMRLLKDIQGWAAALEAHHDEVMRNLALLRAGHPKAQDFEPTGHGGSDPTSLHGISPDEAVKQGKAYIAGIERAHTELGKSMKVSWGNRNGVRPERKPDDVQDVWCVLHLELDCHEPRYRNDLCRPCSERKYLTGDFPTLDDVRYHSTHGRWPRQRIDPTAPPKPVTRRIAGLENLQDGLATLTEGTA